MTSAATSSRTLAELAESITRCRKCPRLAQYIDGIREQFPAYWCRPVPGFGDPQAKLLLLGLAPGRYGSNRTGRMFTGDASGRFLYPALHRLGLANQPNAESLDDGLQLHSTWITAAARCAPPQNKPTPQELKNCLGFAAEEIKLLPQLKVVVALGKIAHDAYLMICGQKKSAHVFRHGAVHKFDGFCDLVDIYHPSRQNTQTGLLTESMFLEVLAQAKKLAGI